MEDPFRIGELIRVHGDILSLQVSLQPALEGIAFDIDTEHIELEGKVYTVSEDD